MDRPLMEIASWKTGESFGAIPYICGWCGHRVVAAPIAGARDTTHQLHGYLLFGVGCKRPTAFMDGIQWPAEPYGDQVEHLPAVLAGLYAEARGCLGVSSSTGSSDARAEDPDAHCCRARGRPREELRLLRELPFDNNYVPPDSRDWVDEIRENGHEANHEIREVTIEQARSVLDFVTMLLELLYEFPDGGRRSQLTRAEATNPAHPSGEV